jgi:TonB dependent receptor-like, beta-barrel/TonB-dependent Receptor Plug Domain
MNQRPLSFRLLGVLAVLLWLSLPGASRADDRRHVHADEWEDAENIVVNAARLETATSKQTVPAEDFELRPLESGGQMLEAIPNVLTAQHTGGGKAEQYFVRGFDADHGTDLAIYFDGVPMNLRSHAHGQGFLDLHFVTPETIERLDATKGPYDARYGDFATAATIEYVPAASFSESQLRVSYGEFDTFRTVGVVSPRVGPFEDDGSARGFVSFEAYHTDGPFDNEENLWRYSALARGELDLGSDLTLSGHLLGYYADWNASGLIPEDLVQDGTLDRFDSLDPSEGGDTTRVQGKLQLDWHPLPNGHLSANAYVSYYDFELFSNFTYFLNNDVPGGGDGIVQRDRDRIYAGGRVEYHHTPEVPIPLQLRGGFETRYDDARVILGSQTNRRVTATLRDDSIETFSLEPYLEANAELLPWIVARAGLRFAWFHFDGRDELLGQARGSKDETRWLPKLNLTLNPFSDKGPLPVDVDGIRNLELFVNFGLGYHSNDGRAVLSPDPGTGGEALPRATGAETGIRTRLWDRVDVALAGWWLNLDDELVFVGDEGTTESVGESNRLGLELAASWQILDWWYLRGDVAYTSARLDEGNVPRAQAPRFVAKASTGVRHEGFAAEFNLRHLGERYATDDRPGPKLSDYTVLDFAARYRMGFLELGFAVENLTDTNWSSSEFFYTSRPQQGGATSEDFHFSPGNPRNVRAWITGYF